MPLEVRQIGIRMNVAEESEPAADTGGAGQECRGRLDPGEREAIVEQCVARVLGALATGRER